MPRCPEGLEPVAGAAAATGGLGAALLFVAQPAAAKAALPLLGGGPAAWGATLLFFQVVLILGYASVDLALRRHGARGVRTAHLLVLGSAAAFLVADTPFGRFDPPGAATFTAALGLLAAQVGLPALALAFTAPAVQVRLLSATGERGRGMYALYAASNAGSLLGLLAYPWLIEPSLPLPVQWTVWKGGVLLFGGVALGLWLLPVRHEARLAGAASSPVPSRLSRWLWMGRAAIPAALLAGVTDYLTRDIAPVPLLWVVPLALYLTTWIIGFSPAARPLVRRAARFQDIAALVALVFFLNQPFQLAGPIVALLALLVIGIAQHGALAESAPPAEWLGRFYVLLSIGGAAGTCLVVLIGPTLFPVPIEMAMALVGALALGWPGGTRWTPPGTLRFLAFGAVAAGVPFVNGLNQAAVLGSLSIVAGVLAMRWRARPHRVACTVLAIVAIDTAIRLSAADRVGDDHGILGRLTVTRSRQGTQLISGSTLHGLEPPTERPHRPEPALYYARYGAYGDLVSLMTDKGPGWRFGVVGLGIGALACTAPPGTRMTFFELNPGVVRLARDTSLFRTLSACAPESEIHLGDARLTLARVSGLYDLLTLDAFSSDAIPTHLLTREAFRLYQARLAPGGVLAFHVSNRFLQLAPVIAALAVEPGWVAAEALPGPRDVPRGITAPQPSSISLVALAADSATLEPLVRGGKWRWLAPAQQPWSDDWAPLASVLTLSRSNFFGR